MKNKKQTKQTKLNTQQDELKKQRELENFPKEFQKKGKAIEPKLYQAKLSLLFFFIIIMISIMIYKNVFNVGISTQAFSNMMHLSWVIFGFNLTIFIFNYSFTMNFLKVEEKNIKSNIGQILTQEIRKIITNLGGISILFIWINVIALILTTFFYFFLKENVVIIKFESVLIYLTLQLSIIVLSSLLIDISINLVMHKIVMSFHKNLIERDLKYFLNISKIEQKVQSVVDDFEISGDYIINILEVEEIIAKIKNDHLTSKEFLDFLELLKEFLDLYAIYKISFKIMDRETTCETNKFYNMLSGLAWYSDLIDTINEIEETADKLDKKITY